MSVKLFVGTINGLVLRVDAQVLEHLKQERANRLQWLRERAGRIWRIGGSLRHVEPSIQRFLDTMKLVGECWEYQGPLMSRDYGRGYGKFMLNAYQWLTHRLAYFLVNGTIDTVEMVCHHCDNPPCCRPDHLFDGDKDINAQDSISKGRSNQGEHNAAAKLTREQVDEIRSLYQYRDRKFGGVALGKKYGVSQAHISRIILGGVWRRK